MKRVTILYRVIAVCVALFFLPLLSIGQHYQAGSGSTPSTGWTPPAAWVDSTGAITTSVMGADGTLAASTIKILVDTRMANRTIAFTVTAANGYTVNWGRKESGVNYANGALAERTYDSTKCQRYAVITITNTGAGAITAFAVSRSSTFVATQVQYPSYLWIAANYVGVAPMMYISNLNCYNLRAAYLMTVTSLGSQCFYNCYALQSITIPSSVTSLGSQCFYNCYALQSVTIPSSVTSLGSQCFSYCYALQSVTIPSSVTSLGSQCFSYCSALQSVTIPSSVTSLGTYCFYNCYALQSITIPSSVTSLGNYCFYNCYALQSITIPSSVTSFGPSCFYGCYSLQSITIPSATTSIPASMFTGDVSLNNVTYTGTETSAEDHGTNMFYQCEQLDTLKMAGLKTQRFAFYGQAGYLNKLGSVGNLHNDSIPVRINWAASTFASATAPQLNLSYNSLSTTQIEKIFRCLPTVGAAGSNTKQVTVVGCTGAAGLSAPQIAIATGKGWQVLN